TDAPRLGDRHLGAVAGGDPAGANAAGSRADDEEVEVVLGHGRYLSMPAMHRYLISTKSSMPYFEPSRPRPDSFTPPNGAPSVEIRPVLIPTIPYSRASATRQTWARSLP